MYLYVGIYLNICAYIHMQKTMCMFNVCYMYEYISVFVCIQIYAYAYVYAYVKKHGSRTLRSVTDFVAIAERNVYEGAPFLSQ